MRLEKQYVAIAVLLLYPVWTDGQADPTHQNSNVHGNITSTEINVTQLEQFCDVTELNFNYSVNCPLENGDVFSFKNFRDWSREKENASSIWLYIKCNGGGTVKLTWPYRSYYLVSLIINGCFISDFLNTKSDLLTSVILDQLQTVQFMHSTFLIHSRMIKQISRRLKTLSKDHECGPKTVKTYIWRNVSAIIEPVPYYHRRLINSDPKQSCIFPNVLVYEESFTERNFSFNLHIFTGRSVFPNVKVLNFTHGDHSEVPQNLLLWSLYHPELEKIDMSYNAVSKFKFLEYSSSTPRRKYINLQFNDISSLGEQEMNSIKQLKTILIDVKNNPFNCECSIISTFNVFLRQYSGPEDAGLLSEYRYLWNLKCKYPPKFAGKIIAELSKEILCDSDVTVYVAQIVILSVTVLILIIIIIIISRYRKDIRILVFTRLSIVLPCQPSEGEMDKRFDAFISYCSSDAEWVIKTLLPGLERSQTGRHFRLCLRDRDFLVGESTSENIISSVENSHYTVLVISKNFLKTEWCILEFQTALNQSLKEKRCHMVLVLLEDIDVSTVEPDFRRCLQTMTYIKTDDILFWDRIQYALARKSRRKQNTTHRPRH